MSDLMPSADDDITALCGWWVARGASLNSRMYAIKRRVEEYVRDKTIVATEYGSLEAVSNGYEWDEAAVADAAPDCVTGMAVTFKGTQEQCERAMSLVLEEVPGMDFDVARTVDKRRAGKHVNAGGALGEALARCRVAKPAKVVVGE